jgi:hypothetical protein
MNVKEWIEGHTGNRLEPVDADLGIEIEVEGENLPERVGDLWRVDRDGSLRGESFEYVSKPIKYADVDKTLNQLKTAYSKSASTVHESIRAGVHVHRNVQDFTPVQLFNLSISYFAIEDLLMRWAGESREGNHFCLRAKDGEFVLFQLQRVADTRLIKHLNTDTIRYCSLNLFSLFKYGTVEFRGMRGTANLDAIKTWTDMIYALTENSKRFLDPLDIIMSMSGSGEDSFLRTLLPDHHTLLTYPGYETAIRESIRRLQFIANTTNWSEFESKINIKKPKSENLNMLNIEIGQVPDIPVWAGNAAMPPDQALDEVLRRAVGVRGRPARHPEPMPAPAQFEELPLDDDF